MKKKIILVLIILILPFCLHAEEITVSVNARYQSYPLFSGPVALTKNGTTTINDTNGTARVIPSDSALHALSIADNSSSDFSLSDLIYYSDYDSFFIKCVDMQSLSQNACNNWKYVVNSLYPPMGSDKSILSDGDVIYFYFGNAHKLSISVNETKADIPVSVKTENYDYANDVWVPLPNILVGATQPDPGNPYSPIVLFRTTTDSNGIGELLVETPGIYNLGIDSDYYDITEELLVTEKSLQNIVISENVPISSPPTTSRRRTFESEPVIFPTLKVAEVVKESAEDRNLITLDFPIGNFIERYNKALKNFELEKPLRNKVILQTASIVQSIENIKPQPERIEWFRKLFKIFGF